MRLQRGFWCVFALAVLPVRGQDSMPLPGFSPSPHFDEQIRESTFAPEVLVRINAPGPAHFDRRLPIRLVVFALPNGNTIPQTVGRRMEPGLDWHFLNRSRFWCESSDRRRSSPSHPAGSGSTWTIAT
jgi:hypothetical protein